MKFDPLNEPLVMTNATAVGTVTRSMVRQRATELAVIDGRPAGEVSKADWEQAKRELTGGSEIDPNEAALEDAPESERWDPLPGSAGHIVTVPSSDDENEEGQSLGERLIDEGMKEAGHDQMLEAARADEAQERDNPSS
jgi:hypothetical protein